MSARTILRDIEYMRDELGAPLEYDSAKRGYYYTEPQFQLPALKLSESDLFGIYLADKLLAQYQGTPVYDRLCSIFQKIRESLPEKITVDPVQEQNRLTVLPAWSTFVDPKVWETVIQCLRVSRQMRISYKTPGKEPQERLVDPYHGIRSEGDWYVVGHCHLVKEIRTFSISRIVSAAKTEECFCIPKTFDFQKLFAGHFGVHIGEEDMAVQIRFEKEVAPYIEERKWHPNQVLEKLENGAIILSLTVNHRCDLQRWILSWGDQATILHPESFATETRELLERMCGNYSQ